MTVAELIKKLQEAPNPDAEIVIGLTSENDECYDVFDIDNVRPMTNEDGYQEVLIEI